MLLFLGFFSIAVSRRLYSLLSLVGLLVWLSIILIVLGFDFIGLTVVILYVGAVSVMFLFVIVMLDDNEVELGFSLGLMFVLLVLVCIVWLLDSEVSVENLNEVGLLGSSGGMIGVVGYYLLSERVLEIVALGLLLLVGLVGGLRRRL